jgi:hypothetical protein
MITHHVARITNPLQRTIDVADKARISAIAFGSRVASVLPCPPSTRAGALDARSPAATPGPAGRSPTQYQKSADACRNDDRRFSFLEFTSRLRVQP